MAAAKSYSASSAPEAVEAALRLSASSVAGARQAELKSQGLWPAACKLLAPGADGNEDAAEDALRAYVLEGARTLQGCVGPALLALAKLMTLDRAYCQANCQVLFTYVPMR